MAVGRRAARDRSGAAGPEDTPLPPPPFPSASGTGEGGGGGRALWQPARRRGARMRRRREGGAAGRRAPPSPYAARTVGGVTRGRVT